MVFQKYPIKKQILLAFIFALLNFLMAALSNEILHLPLFMDMIFVYAASFFGIPCGLITGALHSVLYCVVFNKGIFQLLYVICCITGTVFTWLIVTRHEQFSWSRSLILVFLSTIVISLEGSLIYYFFFSEAQTNSENYTVLFLTYSLVMQDLGVQISAFLARLPVNLIDKAIAVFGGLGIFALRILWKNREEKLRKHEAVF